MDGYRMFIGVVVLFSSISAIYFIIDALRGFKEMTKEETVFALGFIFGISAFLWVSYWVGGFLI